MSTELPKAYDPSTVEPAADKVWLDENLFHADPSEPGAPYSIVIPPPNVTAALHLGHALNNTLQDILIRWHRMMGENTCWFPGTDHAGIATQTVVEKRVLAEEGKRRTDFAREAFVAKIQAWKDEYEKRITDQLKRMGCSCDWERQAFTMDEVRAKAVRQAFFKLFADGLIYRGKRLVNWDPATQTALADDEVENEEVDGHFYYLRYPLADGSGHVTVATTRPETMLGDTAVAINPKDPRAAELRGKKVRLPIVNRIVPIIEDDYVVLPVSMGGDEKDPKAQFATGFLKVTPAHDPNDYEIGQRHGLPVVNVFSPTATISKDHGWPAEDFAAGDEELRNLLGMDRFEARQAVVEWFRQEKLLEEIKPYRHSVGHSYRSHVPIEPYLSDQWYVATTKQIPSEPDIGVVEGTKIPKNSLAGFALRALNGGGGEPWEGKLKIVPERYAKTYQAWHENIRDWCISRQLWWGHRIPVWISNYSVVADKTVFQDTANSDTRAPISLFVKVEGSKVIWRHGTPDVARKSLADGYEEVLYAARPAEAGGAEYYYYPSDPSGQAATLIGRFATQDPDVLDTWFSSGLWPLSTMGWPEETPTLAKWNPSSVLCTAREIITLWVSRMVMFNLYFKDRLPFYDVFVHAMIQDGEGRKMSKSLGNGVDPVDIIESHGADAMRFTLCAMTTHTQDVRMPVEKDATTGKNTSPKFDNGRNFCNKIWNATRFALMNLAQEALRHGGTEAQSNAAVTPATSSLRAFVPSCLPDRWILSRFARTVDEATSALEQYRYDGYAKSCYDFFWGDLCDWYLEAIKPAMRDKQRAPQTAQVLAAVLDGALRLMHPMIPFITEFIWWKLNEVAPDRGVAGLECPPSKRLIKAKFPAAGDTDEQAEREFAIVQEVIVAIRNVRNEHKADAKKNLAVTITGEPAALATIQSARAMIELLAHCTLAKLAPNLPAPADAARATVAGVEIFVEGLVDKAAEEQRIAKRREELTRQIAAMDGRLANESYTKKAPPHLVQQTRDQLAAAEAELAKLG